MSYSDIQKKYGYTRRFIARWWKRYQETGGVADAPRSGRPNTLTLTQKREVARSLKRKPTSSLRKVTKRMKTEHHVSVSKDTVRRIAKEQGLVYRRRKKKPLLTAAHKVGRLRFARRRRPRGFWDRVMWSDEASFALYSLTKGEWVEDEEEAAPQETVKWPPRIRVWAATPPGQNPSHPNPQEDERRGLRDPARGEAHTPHVRCHRWRTGRLCLYADGTHTAKRVRKRLETEGIEQLLPWPAHSSDLNPIENAWSIIERHLEIVHPTSDRGLWQAMQDAWEKIDDNQLLRLCGSLPHRLQAVKGAQGGHTKY